MTILSRNDQNGRSMVEMLGVLAIIGVLSVGGISGYSKAMAKFKLTKAQDQITMILMNIRTAYATSPSYSGLTSAVAIDYNIAPGDMIMGTNTLGNAFGGGAAVYSCATGDVGSETACIGNAAGSAQYFAVSMKNLGRDACISLASSDWGSDGLIGMIVKNDGEGEAAPEGGAPEGGGEAVSSDGEFLASQMPLTLGQAATACGNRGSYSNVTWIYY